MFFGWRVVAGSFVALMLVVGFFTYAFTLFVTPLREEFGVNLEQVMYAPTLAPLLALVTTPFFGVMIDRHPVRLLMTVGCLLTAAGFYAMSIASSLSIFVVAYALTFALSNGLAGIMSAGAVVSRWFVRSRGRALGITTIGTSFGGMVVPALATWWIASGGWREAFENLALVMLLVVTPVVWFNVRGRPAELGLEPEGDGAADVDAEPAELPPPQGIRDIVSQREFWLIGTSVGFLAGTFSAVLANLVPYATELGASEVQASTLVLVLALCGLVGKLLFGMAADRFHLKWGLWTSQALAGLSFLLMALEPGYLLVVVAAMCMGFSTGGFLPVWNAMVARIFGVDSYGRAMGVMGPIVTLVIMPAFILAGRMHDHFGDYVNVLLLFSALIIVAMVLLTPVRVPDDAG
jgi:MFS family permease